MAASKPMIIRSKGRSYRFYPDRGGLFNLNISIDDYASETVRLMAKQVPKSMHSGLRKIGYLGMRHIKKDAKSGPVQSGWKKRSIVTRRFPEWEGLRTQEKPQNERPAANFGGLIQAVGYYRHPLPRQKVEFGFLSNAAYRLTTRLQRGFTFPVSKKMRQLFLLRGFKRPRSVITVPGRNLVTPSYDAHKSELMAAFDQEVRSVFHKRIS